MSALLAIDLGGTRCRIGAGDDPATVRLVEDRLAPTSRAEFLAIVRNHLEDQHARALGVGIPGLAQASLCRWVPNLPFLDGLDLAKEFPGLSIGLGNDAQLSLLAEIRNGVAQGVKDALLLAIGTGIGSAVLANGHIVAGNQGGACSFGWATAALADPGDNANGWLERQASGRALDLAARNAGFRDGPTLVEAVRSGDAAASRALAHPTEALATTLASAICLLDPALVIIGGGLAEAIDVIEPLLLSSLARHLPPHLRGIRIAAARHRSGAGLTGAAFAASLGPSWRDVS